MTILHYIHAYRETHWGFSPGLRQIAAHGGVSLSTAMLAAHYCVEQGYLMRMPDVQHNNLMLTQKGLEMIGASRKGGTGGKGATSSKRPKGSGSGSAPAAQALYAHGW